MLCTRALLYVRANDTLGPVGLYDQTSAPGEFSSTADGTLTDMDDEGPPSGPPPAEATPILSVESESRTARIVQMAQQTVVWELFTAIHNRAPEEFSSHVLKSGSILL